VQVAGLLQGNVLERTDQPEPCLHDAMSFLRAYICARQTQIETERVAQRESDAHPREEGAGADQDLSQSYVDHASFLQSPQGETDAEQPRIVTAPPACSEDSKQLVLGAHAYATAAQTDAVQEARGTAAAVPTISPRDSNLNPSTVADHADQLELYKTMLEVSSS